MKDICLNTGQYLIKYKEKWEGLAKKSDERGEGRVMTKQKMK
jgi:hypothetical protein